MSQSTTTRERSDRQRQSRRDDRLQRNRQLLQNPQAQFFRTRTPEGRMLIGMLIALDRGLHVLRLRAGHQFSFEDVMVHIVKVRNVVRDLQGLITELNGGASVLTERANAEDPQTMGFVPRTEETRQLGLCVGQLDGLLMRIRLTSEDLQLQHKVFDRAAALIKLCHDVTGQVAQGAGTRYDPPRSYQDMNRHTVKGGKL
ncbi:MAG: hypothetical protein NPIRA04_05460 [Nitrospirales bacterium]|nr:MAG: hypothetical protein NPIRA04_05460 [Nitrospirales bacterium]